MELFIFLILVVLLFPKPVGYIQVRQEPKTKPPKRRYYS